jgi:hypothetical protein
MPILLHQCSITRKNEKKLIIFITGLHNKPEGCGASVASAAGPFNQKKIPFSVTTAHGMKEMSLPSYSGKPSKSGVDETSLQSASVFRGGVRFQDSLRKTKIRE